MAVSPAKTTQKPRRSRLRRAAATLVALAIIVVAALWWFGQPKAPRQAAAPAPLIPVTVADASRQDVPIYLQALGTVQAANTVAIRTQIDGGSVFNVSSSENHFGYDLGGGIIGFFNDRVGMRGDITYFRNTTGNVVNGLDLGALHFWRWSAGDCGIWWA